MLIKTLWTNNIALVQLLGLCPLLAVSNTLGRALGLSIATIFTLLVSNTVVSMVRGWVRPEIRIPVFVLIIAASVTAVELVLKAFAYELHQSLGIFLPLIVTNCAILARAEAFASKQPVTKAAADGFATGIAFAIALLALGAMREILGRGSLGSDIIELFAPLFGMEDAAVASSSRSDPLMLIFQMAPGAFIAFGLLIAGKQWLDAKRPATIANPSEPNPAHSE